MLLATFILCLQKEIIFAAKDKSRGCRSWRCRLKQSGRLRYFRNLSKQFYPSTNSLELALRSLNERQDGSFGSLSEEESEGYDIPKIGKKLHPLVPLSPIMLRRLFCLTSLGGFIANVKDVCFEFFIFFVLILVYADCEVHFS